jgi:benzodiazapine receptor
MKARQDSTLTLQIANLGALAVTIIANLLSNILMFDGKTVGEISDAYPNLFTPAGYVFSIWGLIYTLLLLFAVFQALPKQRGKPFLHEIGYYFVLSCVANVMWLYL